ncbi:hypothetical protein [Marinimicrobium locisalis]|uniref:hypothetical protein n=1 Tax=Marinimicrobium locisalis TaxID=546022 RepID=UPI00322222A3
MNRLLKARRILSHCSSEVRKRKLGEAKRQAIRQQGDLYVLGKEMGVTAAVILVMAATLGLLCSALSKLFDIPTHAAMAAAAVGAIVATDSRMLNDWTEALLFARYLVEEDSSVQD